MGLTRVALSRPVFILMVILGLVLLGAVSYTRLGVELFPNINVPVVTVSTAYPGAAPDDVERQVTKPIEDAVSGLSNIDAVASSSTEGRSTVTITFTDRANSDIAATDVERRVSAIRASLPADATAPSVVKFDIGQSAVLALALTGDRPLDQLYRLADDVIKPQLEAAYGVGQVSIAGGLQREVQVQVDPARLRGYGLSIDQVQAALARENVSQPGGSLDRDGQQFNVRLTGLFQSADELRGLIISQGASGTVLLRDVATVEDGFKKVTTQSRLNGQNAVTISVTKQASANEVQTVDAARAAIAQVEPRLPGGVSLEVISDSSKATRASLESVTQTLLEAVILTGLVLLLFLHTLRSTVIVLFAIPTSLISTFLAMSLLGFTLNIMSTLALVLVIGVLVDDSIVVLENIVRRLELGETPWTAALNGRSEIGLAAIAITLVDVVIFLPVAFLSGTTGGFFRQFALVMVCSVLLSLFVSFTLTPMLASRWLKAETIEVKGSGPWARFVHRWEAMFDRLRHGYRRLLGWALRRRWVPPAVAVLSLVGAIAMVPLGLIKFEFVPRNDTGVFTITAELPAGSSLAATDAVMRQVEATLAAVPEIEYGLVTTGSGGAASTFGGSAAANSRYGTVTVVLHERSERQRSVFQVADQVGRDLSGIPGATIRVQANGTGPGGQAVSLRVTGDDPATLSALAARVEQIVRTTPGTAGVTNSGAVGSPEVRLAVDRKKLADFGLNAQQVASALRTSVEGTVVTKLRPEGEEEVEVRLIAADATRADIGSVLNIPVTGTKNGQPVQVKLGQVTSQQTVTGPNSLDRRNRQRVVTVGANLANGAALSDVTRSIDRQLAELRTSDAVPAGYAIQQGGQAEQQASSFGQLFVAMGLSIVLIYMLMAALYESFVLPFATMFALPVAVVGAFVGLAVTGNTLNLLVMIGLIVLMGLVGKNGILLVDYANTLRKQGLSRTEALLEAGPTRLRPILMTSLALMIGLLPMAARIHEGSELWAGIGAAIIGGMLSSTLLSLLVVPTMYTYFDDLQTLAGRAWSWRPARRRAAVAPAERPVTPARPVAEATAD
jgi:HAE1 family hydrophobic/amphiphilic exporter-1